MGNVFRVFRQIKRHVAILRSETIFVQDKFRRQVAFLDPTDGAWSGIEGMDRYSEAFDQLHVERRIVSIPKE